MEKIKNKQNKVKSWRVFLFIFMCTFIGFGGGNALLPIVSKFAVTKYKWIDKREFEDAVLISNMIPGPSVVETLSFIAIKLLGFWKGFIVSLLAFLPHLLFSLIVFILLNKYATKYLYILAACVLPVIIGVLINFGFKYLKYSYKNINSFLVTVSFLATLCFCLFIPSPYNVPAIPLLIGLFLIFFIIKVKKLKKYNTKGKEGEQ
ncbi:chromate transporter [Mycoplasma zalophi]|uniref:Chromate transporter n=1 Tax=Mycoplasma zalophi TaxID=191287 RepID=A0ABS6DPB2_9MOLU|nr:chromate transporter [Mycoplasma zalophi]MBU4691224.1 chromate transporter [Mycoplasma zalophi]MBU4692001.1 chromate transporter [Mycoplasma zalophi]